MQPPAAQPEDDWGPISPELALVCPELRALAVSLLPELDVDAVGPAPHPAPVVVALDAPGDRPLAASARGIVLAAALAAGAALTLSVAVTSDGSVPRRPAAPPLRNAAVHAPLTTTLPTAPASKRRVTRPPKTKAAAPAHSNQAPTRALPTPTPTVPVRRPPARLHSAPPDAAPHRTHAAAPHPLVTAPPSRPRATRPAPLQAAPLLRWPASPSASFFDVVLWRGSSRILDSWPRVPRLQVPSSWTYGGHAYRLAQGTYLWFVYPATGSRQHARYGPLLATGQFTVAASATR